MLQEQALWDVLITKYHIPYNFDFGNGVPEFAQRGVASNLDALPTDTIGTYGYDDTRWFGREIGATCRRDWWNYFYKKVRNFHNSQSFLQAPGILIVKTPEDTMTNCNVSPGCIELYMMVDEPNFVDTIKNLWNVKTPSIQNTNIYCSTQGAVCGSPAKYEYRHTLNLTANNTDATSIYSWHIQKPSGQWLPWTYGFTRTINIDETGNYTVYLRQDNLGLHPSTYGAQTITKSINFPAPCCKATTASCCYTPPSFNEEIEETSAIKILNEQEGSFKIEHNVINDVKTRIYPNPTEGNVQIEYLLSKQQDVKIFIINNLGQVIKKIIDETNIPAGQYIEKFELNNLPQGLYTIRLVIGEERFSYKIVKN